MDEIIKNAAKMIAESELPNQETQAQEVNPAENPKPIEASEEEINELLKFI